MPSIQYGSIAGITAQLATGPTGGAPVGYGDWKLAVELLLPGAGLQGATPNAQVGYTTVGFSIVTSLGWYDATPVVTSGTWSRGSTEFDGRPQYGTGTFLLLNNDGRFSPIDPTNSLANYVRSRTDGTIDNVHFGPGTIIRVSAYSPTGFTHISGATPSWPPSEWWIPQFTGVIRSWSEIRNEYGLDNYVQIDAVEPLSLLASVNDGALPNVAGDDDTVLERVIRLADAAGWQYGYIDDLTGDPTPWSAGLQSTNMAVNRLTEIFQAADSVGATVRSDRSGALLLSGYCYDVGGSSWNHAVTRRGPAALPVVAAVNDRNKLRNYPADYNGQLVSPSAVRLHVPGDAEPIINHVQLARKGGTAQVGTDNISISTYGKRTFQRQDLINKSDTLTAKLAQNMANQRGETLDYGAGPRRVTEVTLSPVGQPMVIPVLATLDVHSAFKAVLVDSEHNDRVIRFYWPVIDGMTHTIESLGTQWSWEATYNLGRQYRPELKDYRN